MVLELTYSLKRKKKGVSKCVGKHVTALNIVVRTGTSLNHSFGQRLREVLQLIHMDGETNKKGSGASEGEKV